MLMAACAALLAGCTNEEMNEGLGIDTPIQVTASVEGALTTRTDNSTESLSTFGLSIKDKDDSYTGNYAGENILAESENGTWTLDKTVLYKGSGQSYYAYAPYKEGHTGESLTFTVDADQATNDLQGSDLLHAAGNVVDVEGVTVALDDLQPRLSHRRVERGGHLADAAPVLHDGLHPRIRGRGAIPGFLGALAHHAVEGEYLARLQAGAIDGLERKADVVDARRRRRAGVSGIRGDETIAIHRDFRLRVNKLQLHLSPALRE